MQLSKASTTTTKTAVDLLVVGATGTPGSDPVLTRSAKEVDKALGGALGEHIDRIRFRGEVSAAVLRFFGAIGQHAIVPTLGRLPATEVMIVGLGPAEKLGHDQVRRAAGVAARYAMGFRKVALDISEGVRGGLGAAAEGFLLGSYSFSRYRTAPVEPEVESVAFLGRGDEAELQRARVAVEATNWARDLANEPPDFLGPPQFAELVRSKAKEAGLSVEVWDEKELEKRGMNGILSVGQGSSRPPRLVTLSYQPRGAKGLLGLVGKGITFDSGGLSIKPAEGMETMKTDCSGAAAVASAMCALPALKPKVKVIAAIPLAENMPAGSAIKPGDVIKHFGKKTAEVLNTDAEGRLVLADALAWAASNKPDAMIDLATLTGGMMVALGKKTAGFFANREDLAREVLTSSARTGEKLWRMPLLEELRIEIDSEVADIKNTGGRYGSPIFGALFLQEFVGDTPWAHVDIAGPARSEKVEGYLTKGATGFGTRLLIDWISSRAGGKER